ncbi:MAG TPA: hypothetical protein VJ276_05930 [Thermoanaerobaculia bacterium]|nr:hypothetical protein [Thermoanaerobaculia bacterium]
MLRKLNFTERAKIPRTSVRVTLRRDPDGVLAFDPQLSFDAVPLLPTARVFIEAYYRTSFMRFDCGSVEAFAPPADRRLTEIDGTSVVRFRVKVVDNSANDHRIIAVADDIVVAEEQPALSGRMPLLPVSFTSALGQQAWRIAHEPNGPVLELNNAIDDVRNVARHDAMFFALVYPAAIREILTRILLVEGHDAHEEGDEWWHLWLRWAARYSSAPLPDDEDEARSWIDEVVSAFCNDRRTLDGWRAARREGS